MKKELSVETPEELERCNKKCIEFLREEVEADLGRSQAKNAVGTQIRVQVWRNCGMELEVQLGRCQAKSTRG